MNAKIKLLRTARRELLRGEAPGQSFQWLTGYQTISGEIARPLISVTRRRWNGLTVISGKRRLTSALVLL